MDHPYSMEQSDSKQAPAPQLQMRRGYLGEDHELFRQSSSLDTKYPFPQSHFFPPSSSVRGGPLKSFTGDPQRHEMHTSDPRFLSQELDDKRYKGHYAYHGVPGIVPNNLNGLANFSHLQNGSNIPNSASLIHSTGAGAPAYNSMINHSYNAVPLVTKDQIGLVPQIPPLHVQHGISRGDESELNENSADAIRSKCSRCKKSFVQRLVQSSAEGKGKAEAKIYKLCLHCRDLQRQRSRRWQKKTKDKEGACRRCGGEIPVDQQRFVLCPSCRKSLRVRKANRAAQGRCVHCSGPIAASIVNGENVDTDADPQANANANSDSPDDSDSRSSSVGGGVSFKVCLRCRENDKIRRTNLESMGKCNRCAKSLTLEDQGKHKVCFPCRQKKKRVGQSLCSSENGPIKAEFQSSLPSIRGQTVQKPHSPQCSRSPQQLSSHPIRSGQPVCAPSSQAQPLSDIPQSVIIPSMNYMPIEQGNILVHSGISGSYNMSKHPHPPHQQDLSTGYPSSVQHMQPMTQNSSDLYKLPMNQLPQLQLHVDQGYQQFIGYPLVSRNGLPYTGSRMGG